MPNILQDLDHTERWYIRLIVSRDSWWNDKWWRWPCKWRYTFMMEYGPQIRLLGHIDTISHIEPHGTLCWRTDVDQQNVTRMQDTLPDTWLPAMQRYWVIFYIMDNMCFFQFDMDLAHSLVSYTDKPIHYYWLKWQLVNLWIEGQ